MESEEKRNGIKRMLTYDNIGNKIYFYCNYINSILNHARTIPNVPPKINKIIRFNNTTHTVSKCLLVRNLLHNIK